MSGGLSFEGLNNAAAIPNNMLIILNDNNMSIDRSVGGMKQYLLHMHTSNFIIVCGLKSHRNFRRGDS